MNPIQNAYCDQCNARIVPMSAEQPESGQPSIRGVSLPTIPLDEKPSIPEPLDAASPEDTFGEAEEADGWLAQFREASDEGEAEIAAEGTDGWLSQLRDSSAEPVEKPAEEPAGGPLEEGEPDNWLVQLRDSAAEEEPAFAHEPAAEAEPVEPVEMPDWLQGLAPLGTEEPPAEPAAAAAEGFAPSEGEGAFEMPAPAEVPDWLQDLAPAEPAAAAAEGLAPSEGEGPVPNKVEETFEIPAPAEVPDWLQDLAPAEPAPAAAEGLAPSEGEGPVPSKVEETFEIPAPAEVPDWLQDLAPAEPAAAAAEGLAPSEGEGPVPSKVEETFEMPAPAEVPDWLQDLAPAEPAPAAAEEAAPEMPIPAEAPDWLKEAAPPSPLPFVDATSLDEAEPPEWLTGLKEAAAPSAPAGITPPFAIEPDTAAAEAAGLARAEIPAWLEAMRPTTEIVEEAVEEEPAETEGLLQGLRGVLAPLQMADLVSARKGTPPAEASEAILARAQLLQRLLSHPTEAPKVKPLKRTAGMAEMVPRLLIAAVLFMVVVALLIPQYTDSYQPPTLTQPDLSSIADMYDLIEGINESDTVLVAFEYGPTQADELNLVAQPILEHLADQKATILIASTQAEGLAVAEALRNAINSQEKVASGVQAKVEYSDQSLGYRPGNATGAAQLLTSVDTDPSLIIVLTAQPEALRWWIEQTRVHYAGSPPPTAVGVSAALEIAASPYLDANANQLKGVVSGLGGATAYEARNRERHGEAEEPAHQLDALMAGHMVIIVSMLAGAAVYAAAGTRGREK